MNKYVIHVRVKEIMLEESVWTTILNRDICLSGNNESNYAAAAADAAKSLQSCLTLCDPIDGSPPHSHSWDSAGKNTGVGCHFLLRCMKVKSESKVAQSCPTLSDPMDCSLPGSSAHGIFQARVLEWGTIAFSVMYSAYKLNKQGDNIQPWHTPFPIWNQSIVPCPVCIR